MSEFTPSLAAREALAKFLTFSEDADGDLIVDIQRAGWVPRDEFARHVRDETVQHLIDILDSNGGPDEGETLQDWLRGYVEYHRAEFDPEPAALSVEAPAETPKLAPEPAEFCMLCQRTGPVNFECGHPGSHLPLATSDQDANGEPLDEEHPAETSKLDPLPTAENTVIRAHIVTRTPGWWGPLIRVAGRYQSIEGSSITFTDSEIVEFEVLARQVGSPQ